MLTIESIRRKRAAPLLAILAVGCFPLIAGAQANPPALADAVPSLAATDAEQSTPRAAFATDVHAFAAEFDQAVKDLDAVRQVMQSQSVASAATGKAQLAGLREKLTALAENLQSGSALMKAIDVYSGWLDAQIQRVNSERQTLGPGFVDNLIQRYQQDQDEVGKARALLAEDAKSIDGALQELTTAEAQYGEMVLATDSDAAVKLLLGVVTKLTAEIGALRDELHNFGKASV
jgi:hypothetical protein